MSHKPDMAKVRAAVEAMSGFAVAAALPTTAPTRHRSRLLPTTPQFANR